MKQPIRTVRRWNVRLKQGRPQQGRASSWTALRSLIPLVNASQKRSVVRPQRPLIRRSPFPRRSCGVGKSVTRHYPASLKCQLTAIRPNVPELQRGWFPKKGHWKGLHAHGEAQHHQHANQLHFCSLSLFLSIDLLVGKPVQSYDTVAQHGCCTCNHSNTWALIAFYRMPLFRALYCSFNFVPLLPNESLILQGLH